MDKKIENIPVLDVLDEVIQPVFVVNHQNSVLWTNKITNELFHKESIELSLKKQNLLIENYKDEKKPTHLIFNTKIGIAISFFVFYKKNYNIYISPHSANRDTESQKIGLIKLIENTVIKRQERLQHIIDRIYSKVLSGVIKSTSDVAYAIDCIGKNSHSIETEWKKVKSAIDTYKGDNNNVARIEIDTITSHIKQQLEAHNYRLHINKSNKSYGVIYGEASIVSSALSGLIGGSLTRETDNMDVTLSLYQTSNNIVWEWNSNTKSEEIDLTSKYVWMSLRGEIQIRTVNNQRILMAIMPCGANITKRDLDLSIWAENEINKFHN